MSKFLHGRHATLKAYVPGEQPKDQQYIKLNTNESPYPPLPEVVAAAEAEAANCHLYSDPEGTVLRGKLAARYGVTPEQIILGNGSDEILSFAFQAYGGPDAPVAFPDISYGFYPVYADLYGIPKVILPLKEDFTVDIEAFMGVNAAMVVIANPNAPTGLALPLAVIAEICARNPESVVLIDEAYVDFGGKSAVALLAEHPNLLVVQTFSKSRSLAGGRLGYGIASPEIIADLNRIKYSINPYNINRMTLAAGAATLDRDEVCTARCAEIAETRAYTAEALRALGFTLTDSVANFLFARPADGNAEGMYTALRERGILVRYFSGARVREYLRITVGTREQMDALLCAIRDILGAN
ncbi:MAG: histidinol-phosphate transaminase [Ruminococcaceae bacterium]|nr:histidinol-phosphate transaminase [Oscillospiraceae bacterium]